MATYWESSCSFGLRYVSWYKYLIVSLVFSHLGFWSGNLFLIAPFPDLCLLVPYYVDDIMTHTLTWEGHLAALRDLFSRVSSAELTIKPSKCMIGFHEIDFVWHLVGKGKLEMDEEKIVKIRNAPQPKTKKQVRSFLGLTGFYRRFIPGYARIASPLTDLTKKDYQTMSFGPVRNKRHWTKYR